MIKGLALVLALSYCSTINAGIIFSNEITGPAPENFNPFTDGQFVDAHVVVSGIGRGSGIAGTSGQDRYNARSWSTSSTIGLNDYFRFTIAPQAGLEIDYSDFSTLASDQLLDRRLFLFGRAWMALLQNLGRRWQAAPPSI
jgi:hypothetical protein